MSANLRTYIVLLAFMGLLALPALAQAPRDVSSDHWAYAAVEDLAARGLIKGYPPEGNFFGGRTVTRYEMATLIDRVLQRMDELQAAKGAQPPSAPAPGVTPAQLDEVRRLVDEYKVELTVIGSDLAKAKQDIAALQADVAALKDQVAQNGRDVVIAKQTAQSAADATKKQAAQIDKLTATKVDAGFGRIKLDGLLQIWIQSYQKSDITRGMTDTFRIRRSELKLSGDINPLAYWTVMIDPSKNVNSANPATNILQDAFLGLHLTRGLNLEVGQQKVPMSMEGQRSSSQLLTVDRAIFNNLPVNAGRVGDIRDLGGLVHYTHPLVDAQLAIFNDAGARQNTTDDNNAKEIMWRADFKPVRYLTAGAYQEISGGVNGPLRTQRQRLGFEASARYGRHLLEAEYVMARDAAVANGVVTNPRIPSHGGYLFYGYSLSPKWQIVGRGEYWNPDRDLHTGEAGFAREYDLTLGANWFMTGHNAKIQFNWVRKNIVGNQSTVLGPDRNLFLVNFQQAF